MYRFCGQQTASRLPENHADHKLLGEVLEISPWLLYLNHREELVTTEQMPESKFVFSGLVYFSRKSFASINPLLEPELKAGNILQRSLFNWCKNKYNKIKLNLAHLQTIMPSFEMRTALYVTIQHESETSFAEGV